MTDLLKILSLNPSNTGMTEVPQNLNLDRPRIYVDFNEMLDKDLVLLSKEDSKVDSTGNMIALTEGKEVYVYMDDSDEYGNPDYLIAHGIVVRNNEKGWSSAAKWCCRIDENGIQHQSEI